jgi:hypothetical protein
LAEQGVIDRELESVATSHHRQGFDRNAMRIGLNALAAARRGS